MLTVHVLASFDSHRPGDMLTLPEAQATALIEKRLVQLAPQQPEEAVSSGTAGENVGEAQPRSRANGRKKADAQPFGEVPAPDAEQG